MPWEAEHRWKVRTTRITRRGTRSLLGGGLDRALTPHWAFRGEGDYEFMHVDFGVPHYSVPAPMASAGNRAESPISRGSAWSAGVVYHIGAMAPPPAVTLVCSANPASVFPGDPVTVTAMAGDAGSEDECDLQPGREPA